MQSVLFLPCMLCYMHLILMASTLQHYKRPYQAFKGVRCVVALCLAGSSAQSSCAMAIHEPPMMLPQDHFLCRKSASLDLGSYKRALPLTFQQFSLRHLELELQGHQPWLASFLAVVRQCPFLESLAMGTRKIPYKEHLGSPDIPTADLSSMKELKHVKLQGLCPENGLLLPPDCQLNLCVLCCSNCDMVDCKRNTYAVRMKKHTTVLSLTQHIVSSWPRYLRGFAQLQCLTLEIIHFSRVGEPKPDLAAL